MSLPAHAETIPHLLGTRAAHHSAAAAIVATNGAVLTFDELKQRVDLIVEQLHRIGLGANDRIALVLPNGPEMAIVMLGVASCGTCAPLNPAYQHKEFEFYLSDLRAKALIVMQDDASAARAVARDLGIPVIDLVPSRDGGPTGLEVDVGSSFERTEVANHHPDAVALVLHTSGTTSRPKLVPLSHRNLCESAHHVASSLGLSHQDRCLNVMPLFHIHGLVGALLASLASGGSVICAPGFSGDDFFPWMDELHPTWYSAVPTMHQTILQHAEKNRSVIGRRPLRFIRSSSSALAPQLMATLESTFACPVIEAYGMTEAAHQMACNPLPPGIRKRGSVGRAAGPDIRIMDDTGQVLPAGISGEIVVRGPNIMAGYADNPEANRAAFIEEWFRTGDQGYLDEEDYLFITGRLKEIFNRGGEKVSPREVDEALLDHPDIAQAVAFAVPHPTLGEDVAAAVVLRDGATPSETAIREFLFGRLAAFKIPSQILIVHEIPKGATGKVQRIGLAEKLGDRLRPMYSAPANAVERVMACIYAEVLSIDWIGAADNFFLLGGDSLRATQVLARVQAIFAVQLPLVTLFRKPSVSELSEEVLASLSEQDLARVDALLAEVTKTEEGASRVSVQDRYRSGPTIAKAPRVWR